MAKKNASAKATTTTKTPKAKKPAGPKKLSALSAAAKVLAQKGEPMTCQEMLEVVVAKGLWSSPKGKTPAATLYSAILREMKIKGADARFKKTERGKFAATGKE
jgi:hypothetical protein